LAWQEKLVYKKRHRLMEQTPVGEQVETLPSYHHPPDDDFEMFIEDDIPF
jgi:hypothetical protein